MVSAILFVAAPVLLQQLMHACVGMFDKIIAGNLPEEIVVAALDGLGIGSYIGWFIGIAMTGVGIGGQAVIARAMGAGDLKQSARALGQAMLLSVVWGILVGIVLWIGIPWIAQVCQLNAEATSFCVEYTRILSYALPFNGVMLVGAMCMLGSGETLRPSMISIAVNVVNIVVSWALSGADFHIGERLIENPFAFDMDVRGIAMGTAVSFAVGAVLTLVVLIRGVKDLALRPAEMRLDRDMLRRIVRVGVPNFFEGISMWAVNLFVLMIIGDIAVKTTGGAGLIGAHVIAIQWEAFSFLPGFAIGTAAGALAGQYLGAGNPAMAQRAVLTCTGVALVVMGLVGVGFVFGGEMLTRIVSSNEVHIAETPKLLLICGTTQVFFAITMVIRQGLRGVGDTRWTFLITTVSSYGVRLPAAFVLGSQWGLTGVWIGLCGELGVRALLFGLRFRHGGWKRLEV